MAQDDPAAEIERLTRALALARGEHDADRAATQARMDDFLSVFSHELRNPLGAIASATEVLNRIGGKNPDEIRARDVIRRQIQNLTRMMQDLLDVNRSASGKVPLSRAPLELGASVQRAAAAFTAAARSPEERIKLDLTPVWINGDSMRVEQIVAALLSNSARFTPAEGTITVTVTAEGDSALLVVSDTGVGIHPSMVERVFEMFVQADGDKLRRQGGLGIGLTLVKNFVELHGGSVVAISDGIDRGARFEVRFPRVATPGRT